MTKTKTVIASLTIVITFYIVFSFVINLYTMLKVKVKQQARFGALDITSENIPRPMWISLSNDTVEQNRLTYHIRRVAYYDDRRELNLAPCLRIYALSTGKPTSVQVLRFLRFVPNQRTETNSATLAALECTIDIPWALTRFVNNRTYHQFLISCPFTPEELSTSEIWVSTVEDIQQSAKLDIQGSFQSNPVSFAVCVKPMFGRLSDSHSKGFIEWIEINRIFGVEEFHIYNVSVETEDQIEQIFNYYEKLGILQIHKIAPPFEVEGEAQGEVGNLLTRPAFLDCIMRHYKRVQLFLIIDLDEVLVPRGYSNYSAMFHGLNINSASYGSYLADMYVFLLDNHPDVTRGDLFTMRNRYYTNYDFGKRKPLMDKSFVNPTMCILAFHHYCILGDNAKSTKLRLPADAVRTHHYRSVDKWPKYRLTETKDDIMLTFEHQLHIRVNSILQDIDTKV